MTRYLALAILTGVGLLQMLESQMILVTRKTNAPSGGRTAVTDALCCSVGCSAPVCPGSDVGTADEPHTKLTYPKNTICKCDTLCVEYGDCCPGYSDRCPASDDYGGAEHRASHQCVRTSKRSREMHEDTANGFFMVSVCPGSAEWGTVVDGLCRDIRPHFNETTLTELNHTVRSLPVFSSETGLHYKNIYCALCNGAPTDSMVPWIALSDTTHDEAKFVPFRFEPPRAPGSAVNITRPRTCTADFEMVVSAARNSSIAASCSRIPPDMEADLAQSEQPCLACQENISTGRTRCVYPQQSVLDRLPFKIPFDFPSLVDETERSYGSRPASSCVEQFYYDPVAKTCRRFENHTVPGPSQGESLCHPWRRGQGVAEMLLEVRICETFSEEALLEGIKSAFQKVVGFSASVADVVWKQESPEQVLEPTSPHSYPNCEIVFSMAVPVSGPENISSNSSIEQPLDSVAEYLLDRRDNQSHRMQAVEYLFPCGDYTVEECMSDISEAVQMNASSGIGGLESNAQDTMSRPDHGILRKIGYVMRDETSTGRGFISKSSKFLICNRDHIQKITLASDQAQLLLYIIGTLVSLVGLLLTFITYSVLPGLRTVPGVGTMNLVAATFWAQLGLLLADRATADPGLCTSVAVVLHYFWLASVFWTSCLALGLSRTLGNTDGVRRRSNKCRGQTAKLNALYGWGVPVLIVAACLIVHFAGNQDRVLLKYGTDAACWIQPKEANLVAFGVPVLLSLSANVCMFIKAARGIRASKKATRCLKSHVSVAQRVRMEMTIYVKMSLLMGLSWLWAFLVAFTGVEAFWFVFIILNTFQGAYVFLAFVCSRRVLRMLRSRFRGRDGP